MSLEYMGRVDRLLNIKQVSEKTSLGQTKIYEMIKLNEFPPPVKLGRSRRWRESDIDRWIASLPLAV
ncbi:helix-turn-helix transcriptional regulator [Nitratifractor salsuginis]|uniref:Prophage CP4-57 regulatory n=1 Tax=Nitratifractor salsuginis (strain DSM 16511 / JCM 12458 / E9I37-1) TaxID=749222 RepID=E6X1T0_NITSE|nr:AlpA family phage regulatory protein [Nitratifractor salsuginis]ADV47071.1 Prophage CP4-57 regulatory [Nitratifractor salsuginis DSM 16511]